MLCDKVGVIHTRGACLHDSQHTNDIGFTTKDYFTLC